jgi:hypothetical protein
MPPRRPRAPAWPRASYERYLVTCATAGIEPVSRERALGLVQEWAEVLSGRWKTDHVLAPTGCLRPILLKNSVSKDAEKIAAP